MLDQAKLAEAIRLDSFGPYPVRVIATEDNEPTLSDLELNEDNVGWDDRGIFHWKETETL